MTDMRKFATVLRLAYPNYSTCSRCNTPWKWVEPRSVDYIGCSEEDRIDYWNRYFPDKEPPKRWNDYPSSGIFALCTLCWDELTPEERLPYYEELWYKYPKDTTSRTRKEII